MVEALRSLVSQKPYRDYQNYLNLHLEKGGSILDPLDEEGNSLLHWAVIYNEHEKIETLLKLGADFQQKNFWGYTPLDFVLYFNKKAFYGYLPKEGSRKFEMQYGVEYLSQLQFSSYSLFRSVYLKTQKIASAKSVSLGNLWSQALFQKEIAYRKEPEVEIKWVIPLLGYGVFAKNEIPALSYIGEYTGVLRQKNRKMDGQNNFIFGYVIGPKETPWVIDARERGNFTRFIKHSDEPNLISRWMIFQGLSHVIFFTKKRIPQGAQLTYDYGPNYWKKRSIPLQI